MRITLLIAAVVALLSTPAEGGDASKPKQWEIPKGSSLCIEEQSTGFAWRGGNWIGVDFASSKFIVKKIDPVKGWGNCVLEEPKDDTVNPNHPTLSRCYNVREFGGEYNPLDSRFCTEFYSGEGDFFKLTHIICTDGTRRLVFKPDGWFHRGHTHEQIGNNPKDDYKDSLTIVVGHCATM
jgi:hypothetical protein